MNAHTITAETLTDGLMVVESRRDGRMAGVFTSQVFTVVDVRVDRFVTYSLKESGETRQVGRSMAIELAAG
jgi:hypothetical protein